MTISLTSLPANISFVIHTFLPTAGVLTRNISKAMTKAFDKEPANWVVGGKQYGFKIVNPKNGQQSFKAQYEVLKKTNALLMKLFPFLQSTQKDPLQLHQEISGKLRSWKCCDPQIFKGADFLASQTTQKECEPSTKALITLLRNYPCEEVPFIILGKLSDQQEILEAICERFAKEDSTQYVPLLYSILNPNKNFVETILKKFKYIPNETHILAAILMVKHSENKTQKEVAKEILKTIFNNASESEKKKINEVIKAEKEKPTDSSILLTWKLICNANTQYSGKPE